MAPFEDLWTELSAVRDSEFLEEAARLLRQERDWIGSASESLDALSDDEFFRLTMSVRVAGVQPRAFPVHIETGRFALVLNHYDRADFEALEALGRITPHYHHFSFCSRILRGRYYHLLFSNAGTLQEPILELSEHRWQVAADVFLLPFPTFHHVMSPDHDTVTLMIRGRPQFANPHIGDSDYNMERAKKDRSQLERALRTAAS